MFLLLNCNNKTLEGLLVEEGCPPVKTIIKKGDREGNLPIPVM